MSSRPAAPANPTAQARWIEFFFAQAAGRNTHKIKRQTCQESGSEASLARRQMLFVTAAQKMDLHPAMLVHALRSGNLMGKGLLMCVVDACSGQDEEAKLQTPVATEPLMAPLFKKLRDHHVTAECTKHFRAHLPRKAAGAFQLVPTDIWKGWAEQRMIGRRVSRQALKATNVTVLLIWFLLGNSEKGETSGNGAPMLAALELLLMLPGATVPGTFRPSLTEEVKTNLFFKFNNNMEANFATLMGIFGLDPVALQNEPLFQELRRQFTEHVDGWALREENAELRAAAFWWGGQYETQRVAELKRYTERFFHDKKALLLQLRQIMGADRASAAMQASLRQAEEDERQRNSFVTNLGYNYAPPCPACGKPLHSHSGYACGCQRPVPPRPSEQPAPSQHQHQQTTEPRVEASRATEAKQSHRRSKNIQTSFKPATAGQKQPEPSKHAGPTAPPQVDPRSATPAALAKRKPNRSTKTKEQDPAMARLREEVRRHQPKEEEPSLGPLPLQAPSSRRARRSVPQGDEKLAKMLAAGELLQSLEEREEEAGSES